MIQPILGIAVPRSEHIRKVIIVELLEQLDHLVADEWQDFITHIYLAISRFLGV